MTARVPPAHMKIALPDLRSRLEASQVAALQAPDDEVLVAVLRKQFTDRQLVPSPSAMTYLQRHMERSFDTAQRIVAAMDRRSLSTGAPITRALAQSVLEDLARET